jgi:diguanylate cyclase (GGDEF)-like protein
MVSIDYPSLEQIELHLIGGSRSLPPVALGRTLRTTERPWPSSWHAAALDLEPGTAYEILLRVETRSTMLVPMALATPEAFHTREATAQAFQGLLAGAGLCLLLYSLAQWASLRDPMFLYYSLTLAGITVFFVAYFGLGPQHLWGDNAWFAARVAPLSILLGGLLGGFLFIDRALRVGEIQPRVSRTLRGGAIVAGLVGGAFVADWVDYRIAQLCATILGLLPMLLTLPVAWTRARGGDRVGLYVLVGWGVYALGTLIMVGLLRGYVPSNFWTQHAFQFGSLFEMLMWMCVLGVRVEALRAAAQRAGLERDALRTMAHTDPLTGLPNRRGLNDVLARWLQNVASQRMAAVYLLDLDGFKSINDRLGHDAGDEVLVGVARRLKSTFRGGDLVARIGGDEFVAVATGLGGDADARAIGQKVLAAFEAPFTAAGRPCRVGITIGYAIAPLDGHDAQSLLKRADAAMYAGKQAGRCCLRRGTASVGLVGA